MNKLLAFYIGLIIFGLLVLITAYNSSNENGHRCIDPHHILCDAHCECDGMKCDEKLPADSYYNSYQLINARDYQIDIWEDSIKVWDGSRLVGTIPMWDNSPLDSLIQKDNE